jgi:hypothetical protein
MGNCAAHNGGPCTSTYTFHPDLGYYLPNIPVANVPTGVDISTGTDDMLDKYRHLLRYFIRNQFKTYENDPRCESIKVELAYNTRYERDMRLQEARDLVNGGAMVF